MRLLEKSPNDRYANASLVLERLQAQLRAQTREDPNAIVRGALVETGFLQREKRTGSSADASPPRSANRGLARAIYGFVGIAVAFAVAVVAIEGTSWSAGDGRRAGDRPLELVPERAGGLRVVATPWAYVKVDGQQVETTPFARPIPLPAGKHFVTLVHPDATPVEREVVIAPGEISSIDVTLDVNAGPNDGGVDAR